MAATEKVRGEVYVGLDVFLTALLPVVAVLTYGRLSSINSLAWSTFIAALICAALVVARKRLHELKNVRVLMYGALSALYIGILFYGFYYAALSYTSPGNVSILILFQVFTAFVFFNVIRGEPFSRAYKIGAALMIAGALIVLARDWQSPNVGDLLVLVSAVWTPLGNYYQQKGRDIASTETLLLLRTGLASIAFFLFLSMSNTIASLSDVREAFPYLLFNSVAVFVLAKIFWIEGIHRMSVTKAIALAALGPFFTLLFSLLILGEVPNAWQLVSLAPFVVGVLLLTDQIKLRKR